MAAHRCLIELDTAITNGVPIVALNCVNRGYDFVEAVDFMLHLETCLGTLNPDALVVLRKNNVDPIRLAHKLHSVIPNIIAIPLDVSASNNAIKATMADLVKAVKTATPMAIAVSFEPWSTERKRRDSIALEHALGAGTIRGTQRGRMLQKLERAEELADELRVAQDELHNAQDELREECKEHEAAMAQKDAIIERLLEKL